MKRRERGNGFFERDNFWFGFILGLCIPIAVYGILLTMIDFVDNQLLPPDTSISRGFRERTLSVIAICSNLLPFHFYNRRYANNTMRGMVFPTMAFVALWFWFYGRQLVGLS